MSSVERFTAVSAAGLAVLTAVGQVTAVDPNQLFGSFVKDGPAWVLVAVLLWNLLVTSKETTNRKRDEDDERHNALMSKLDTLAGLLQAKK